ncbi:MAG: sugar phosphate isomerase/epimerase, partial [Verrucomicrobiales bacterium]|nr:sugar phosphate isomerase/epimerase [Verrucomicrobiales bacterium]
MNRRNFLALTAGSVAASALPARAAEPLKLKYLLASALYGDMPLAEVLPEVAAAHCGGLDIWGKAHATHREQLDEMGVDAFAGMLQKAGVKLVCSTRYPLGPFGLEKEFSVVQKLGGSLIVVGAKGPKNVEGEAARQGMREFLEQMKPHADKAQEHGIVVAIENHANSLLHTPDSIRCFAEMNTHPGLGVAFAPHHLHEHVPEIPGLIRDLGAKNLPFVYFQEYGIGSKETVAKAIELQQLPGYGTLDYKPLLTALREVAFDGWVEIFMHPTPR